MAQQAQQGKRLDGTPFEGPDLIYNNYTVFAARNTRGSSPDRNEKYREPNVDIDGIWFGDRSERGAFGNPTKFNGRNLENFLLGWLFFENHKAQNFGGDEEWGPIRPLGQGSFGTVGLWQKRDDKNNIIDEVVCKESRLPTLHEDPANGHDPADFEVDHKTGRRLLTEAAIQRDINKTHPGVAPHLRGYKFIQDSGLSAGKYRFYVENCPYGNLSHLARLYRCWDTFLPETFIWHVFNCMANACEALRDCPPKDSMALNWKKSRGEDYADIRESMFCLHLDMKPPNTLLGYPHDGQEYPSALLSDFGISVYTSYHREGPYKNPGDLWWRGTEAYFPTEQCGYGANWASPPDGGWIRTNDGNGIQFNLEEAVAQRKQDNEDSGADVMFSHAHNIYGIGHIMYEFLTLTNDYEQLMNERAPTLEAHRRNGNHQIAPIDTKTVGFYSAQLRGLIHRCLDPNPVNRPTQLELMRSTRRGLRMALKRAKRGKISKKVYFRGHEINDMPRGNANFPASLIDTEALLASEFVNPDLPKLRLPVAKYGHFEDKYLNPTWKTMYDKANPHKRWFKPVGAPPDPPSDNDDSSDDGSDFNPGGNEDVDENGDYQAQIFHSPRTSRQGNDDQDQDEDEDEGDQNQSPRGRPRLTTEEQQNKIARLRKHVTQKYAKRVTATAARKLLRRNNWDVEGAGNAFRKGNTTAKTNRGTKPNSKSKSKATKGSEVTKGNGWAVRHSANTVRPQVKLRAPPANKDDDDDSEIIEIPPPRRSTRIAK